MKRDSLEDIDQSDKNAVVEISDETPDEPVALDGNPDEAEIDPEAQPLHRKVDDAVAKERTTQRLADAIAGFGSTKDILAEPKKPANDNYRPPKQSWPLLEQITRNTFEPDRFQRAKMLSAIHRIRNLIDTTGVDVLGLSVHVVSKDTASIDFELQRNDYGKVVYEPGQTLDRKWRVYDSKDGEKEAKRCDGPVRTAFGSKVNNGGYDPARDDPAAFRRIDARNELEEIIVAVGPLWPHLVQAIAYNATLTAVGAALGAKNTQAPGVGAAIIKIALCAAIAAIERCEKPRDEDTYAKWLHKQPFGTAVPARRLKLAMNITQFGQQKAA